MAAETTFDSSQQFDCIVALEQYMKEYGERTGTIFRKENTKLITAANPKRVVPNPALKNMYMKYTCECYGPYNPRGTTNKKER